MQSVFSADCTLVLEGDVRGKRGLALSVVSNGRVEMLLEGKRVVAPVDTQWRVNGDLRANAAFFSWSPSYGIVRRGEAEMKADPTRPYLSKVRAVLVPPTNELSKRSGNDLGQIWDLSASENQVVVIAWIAEGRITQVKVDKINPQKGSAHGDFLLSEKEATGQPALLLWAGGHFVASKRQFPEPVSHDVLMAAMLNDWTSMERVVAANPKLGLVESTGAVPLLMFVAEAGADKVVAGLVAANPIARPRIKESAVGPIHWAATNGRLAVIDALLTAGLDKNAKDKDHSTPFLRACACGHTPVVARLLKAGADPAVQSLNKQTPAAAAIDAGYDDIVELLEPLTVIPIKDGDHTRSVLKTQAKMGHAGIVRWLLDLGVKPDPDPEGQSALALAARGGHEDCVSALLRKKAKVFWSDNATGDTVLHYAVTGGSVDCVRALLIAGADWKIKNKRGLTPFDQALLDQRKSLVEEMVSRGARLDAKKRSSAALLEAVMRIDAAQTLTYAIADGVLLQNPLGEWPIMQVAAQYGAKQCMAVLRAEGIDEGVVGPQPVAKIEELSAKPVVVRAVIPQYEREGSEQKGEREVIVDALVDVHGKLRFARILRTDDAELNLAVLNCLDSWELKPAKRGEETVAVRVYFPVKILPPERRVYAFSAVDVLPKVISQKLPKYPEASRMAGEEARVLVRYTVNEKGDVENIEVLERSSKKCADAAVKVMKDWKYHPGIHDGKPVAVEMVLPMIFNLEN